MILTFRGVTEQRKRTSLGMPIMGGVGRLVSAALALAAVVALSGGSASATRSTTDLTAARAFAVQVAVPGQPGGATPSVSAPPDAVGVGGSFAYPADGSVINAGSVTYGAFANPGASATSSASADISTISHLRRRRHGCERQRQGESVRELEEVVGRLGRIDRDRARHPGPAGDTRLGHAVPDRRLGHGHHAPAGPDVARHEALRGHARVRDRHPGTAQRRPLRAPGGDRGDDRLRGGGREVHPGSNRCAEAEAATADGDPQAQEEAAEEGAARRRGPGEAEPHDPAAARRHAPPDRRRLRVPGLRPVVVRRLVRRATRGHRVRLAPRRRHLRAAREPATRGRGRNGLLRRVERHRRLPALAPRQGRQRVLLRPPLRVLAVRGERPAR